MMAPVSSRWAKSSMTPSSGRADYHCEVLRRVADLQRIGRPNTEKAEHSVGACIEKCDQGRKTRMKPRNGKARSTAVRSGAEIVMFFGAISPITMKEHDNEKGDARDMP